MTTFLEHESAHVASPGLPWYATDEPPLVANRTDIVTRPSSNSNEPVVALPVGEPPRQDSPLANLGDDRSLGPQSLHAPTRAEPVIHRTPSFGNRAMRPLATWEGVIDEINGSHIKARLMRLENGKAASSKIEFSEFSLADLSTPSDKQHLAPGAVFYWTLARYQNEAGTVSNASFFRLRRVPDSGPSRQIQAQAEASTLFREI